MLMSNTVKFLYKEENEDRIQKPISAGDNYENIAKKNDEKAAVELSKQNIKILDAMKLGWYVFLPTNEKVTLSDDIDSNHDISDLVSIKNETRNKKFLLIDSLISVKMPDGIYLLLTKPLYEQKSPVVSQLLKEEEETDISIPIDSDCNEVLNPDMPILQVIPINKELVESEFGYGIIDEELQKEREKINGLQRLFDQPYLEEIRDRKYVNKIINN